MLDVARVRALLAIGDPVGIGFERFAPPLAVGLTLEAPKKYDLVDGPDIGGEDADRLAQMPNMDRHALGLVQFEPGAEAPGHHRVGPHIDDHGCLPWWARRARLSGDAPTRSCDGPRLEQNDFGSARRPCPHPALRAAFSLRE